MPCPHFDLKIVGRSRQQRSAVASAAYQSGEKLFCEFDRRTRNYSQRSERIVMTEIMLPDHAPRAYLDRETLWNSVEMNEKKHDAQYARRFVMALPKELSYTDNLAFVRQYCQEQFVAKGMCVDLAYHHDGDGNPHVHILTTMRAIDEQGRWMPKCHREHILDKNGQPIKMKNGDYKSRRVNTTDWDDPGNCEKWRHAWEVLQNQYLEEAGRPERIDMRSYERQENGLVPTIHMGPLVATMEQNGERTFIGDMNRDIKKYNNLITGIKNAFRKLYTWVDEYRKRPQEEEQRRRELGPPVRELLADYLEQRMKERAGWHTKARLNGLSKDMIVITEIMDWLDEHRISHTADLMIQLNALEDTSRNASALIKQNETRRKEIAMIREKAKILADTQAVYDAYSGKWFAGAKARYAEEHADELKAHGKAYIYLKKHNAERYKVAPHEFDAELTRMAEQDAAAASELERIRDDLTMLRKVKRMIDKVAPERNNDKQSLRGQLPQEQHQTHQLESERNKTTNRKHEQER
ncbi:MAG: MobQ family relaxase [Faecousia sp.]